MEVGIYRVLRSTLSALAFQMRLPKTELNDIDKGDRIQYVRSQENVG